MDNGRRYKVGSRVRLLRAGNQGDEAVILERIVSPTISTGQYESSYAGAGLQTQRYRVQVVRTGQELVECEDRLEACSATEYESA